MDKWKNLYVEHYQLPSCYYSSSFRLLDNNGITYFCIERFGIKLPVFMSDQSLSLLLESNLSTIRGRLNKICNKTNIERQILPKGLPYLLSSYTLLIQSNEYDSYCIEYIHHPMPDDIVYGGIALNSITLINSLLQYMCRTANNAKLQMFLKRVEQKLILVRLPFQKVGNTIQLLDRASTFCCWSLLRGW